MTIIVTAPGRFEGEGLRVGEWYDAQPAAAGTEAQNNTWHALVQEYWASGQHGYEAKSYEHFREIIKLYLGAGAEKHWNLVDDRGRALSEPEIRFRVKSWADYTRKERRESIDRLIREMEQAEVDTPKYREILQGMDDAAVRRGARRCGAELAMEAAG